MSASDLYAHGLVNSYYMGYLIYKICYDRINKVLWDS